MSAALVGTVVAIVAAADAARNVRREGDMGRTSEAKATTETQRTQRCPENTRVGTMIPTLLCESPRPLRLCGCLYLPAEFRVPVGEKGAAVGRGEDADHPAAVGGGQVHVVRAGEERATLVGEDGDHRTGRQIG